MPHCHDTAMLNNYLKCWQCSCAINTEVVNKKEEILSEVMGQCRVSRLGCNAR
jgi:hypothetical protein